MRRRPCAAMVVALLALSACNRDQYRVIEREDRSDAGVRFVLLHQGHKIYADCDLATIGKLDPNSSCGLRPLRNYACTLGRDRWGDPLPLSDLTCKDGDGRNVYLYVSKEE